MSVSTLLSAARALGGLTVAQNADPEAEKKAIEQLKGWGVLVLEIAQNDNHLDVSYITSQVKIANEHLAPLKDLGRMTQLNLRGQEITDDGLPHIAGQKGLVKLHLEKTKITDKGLETIKGLENLEYLNVYGTEIGDAGLAHLENLKKLKALYLWMTKVTDAGVMKFQAAVPGCKVNRGT